MMARNAALSFATKMERRDFDSRRSSFDPNPGEQRLKVHLHRLLPKAEGDYIRRAARFA